LAAAGRIAIVPAPKKITAEVAAELLRRRSEGASARALEREFGISNQAIGKFFKREDAKRAAERERAHEQGRQPPPAWLHLLGFASESERSAYYEARAHLSERDWLNWHDVRAGRLTPAEQRRLRAAGTE
jgi:ribonuclease D